MSAETTRPESLAHVEHPRCPFCHEGVRPDETKHACDACMAWHHRECWSENGGRCATCGAQGREAGAEPVSSRLGPPEGQGADARALDPQLAAIVETARRARAREALFTFPFLGSLIAALFVVPLTFVVVAVSLGKWMAGENGAQIGGTIGVLLGVLAVVFGAAAYLAKRARDARSSPATAAAPKPPSVERSPKSS